MITLLMLLYSVVTADRGLYLFDSGTTFHNPHNWEAGELPCAADLIVMDSESGGYATIIDKQVQFETLVFPENGEIFLQQGITIVSPDQKSIEACGNKRERKFYAPAIQKWYDPQNWFPLSASSSQKLLVPFLHVELVPEQYDHVEFPIHSAYRVALETRVNVGWFKFGGLFYSTHSFWNGLTWTFEGQLQFLLGNNISVGITVNDIPFKWPSGLNKTVSILGHECRDRGGCVNSNFDKEKLAYLCNNVHCPDDYPCENPLKPEGHCCYICGALLKFSHSDVNMNQLTSEMVKFQKDFMESHNGPYLRISFLRLRSPKPLYQIAMSVIDEYENVFDRDLAENTLQQLENILQSSNAIFENKNLEIIERKVSDNLTNAILVAILVVIVLLIILVSAAIFTVYYLKGKMPWRFIVWGRPRSLIAWWRASPEEDEIHLELAARHYGFGEMTHEQDDESSLTESMQIAFGQSAIRYVPEVESHEMVQSSSFVDLLGDNEPTMCRFENPLFSDQLSEAE